MTTKARLAGQFLSILHARPDLLQDVAELARLLAIVAIVDRRAPRRPRRA